MPLVIHGKDNDVGNLKVKLSRQRERERVETFPSKRLPEIARRDIENFGEEWKKRKVQGIISIWKAFLFLSFFLSLSLSSHMT